MLDASSRSTPSPVAAIALQCLNASLTKWRASPSCRSADDALLAARHEHRVVDHRASRQQRLVGLQLGAVGRLDQRQRRDQLRDRPRLGQRRLHRRRAGPPSTPFAARIATFRLLTVSLIVFAMLSAVERSIELLRGLPGHAGDAELLPALLQPLHRRGVARRPPDADARRPPAAPGPGRRSSAGRRRAHGRAGSATLPSSNGAPGRCAPSRRRTGCSRTGSPG